MAARYQQLREALEVLAAPADEQDKHLCAQGFTAFYGNDELALEFDDAAAGDMRGRGELTQAQMDAAKAVDELLSSLSGEEYRGFWQRSALWNDPRWEQVRRRAGEALSLFPPECPLSTQSGH